MMEDNPYQLIFDDTYPNNTFENNMSELSEFNPPSIINKISSTLQTDTIKKEVDMLNNNKIPYPNADEIPLIKIKNENYLENDQDIGNYINSLVEFDDNKFNICSQCNKENHFFCKYCQKHFCNKCSKECDSKMHTLIKLNELCKEIEEDKNKIKLIKSKYILYKEKQNNDGIEKEDKNYDKIIDDNNIIEIEEKPMDYTNDIILIDTIMEKNYINYFHYINIQQCLYYIQGKYEGSMKIKYNIIDIILII